MNEQLARMDEPEATQSQNSLQLVGFVIGEQVFGVDILTVQEIIRDAAITPIPDSPEFLEGVINLRGRIIPVIDLRKRLKLTGAASVEKATWIVILLIEGRVTGFVVDRVTKVLNLPVSQIKPPPDIVVAGLKSQYVRGVCKMDRQLLILLDFSRILMAEEIKKLKAMKRTKVAVNS